MLESVQNFAHLASLLLLGLALGIAWLMAIVSPNVAYDRRKGREADADVRAMLKAGSPQIGFVLLAATAFSVLAGHFVSAGTSLLAAFGFFTNLWTLASHKQDRAAAEDQSEKKSLRVLAAAFSLIFSLVVILATALAFAGL